MFCSWADNASVHSYKFLLLLIEHSDFLVTDPSTHIDKLGVKTNMDHNGELEEALLNSFKGTN